MTQIPKYCVINAEMMSAVNNMQSVTVELLRLTPSTAQELVTVPVTLTAAEELAVEHLLDKMAAVLVMLEEEDAALQVALQKSDDSTTKEK